MNQKTDSCDFFQACLRNDTMAPSEARRSFSGFLFKNIFNHSHGVHSQMLNFSANFCVSKMRGDFLPVSSNPEYWGGLFACVQQSQILGGTGP